MSRSMLKPMVLVAAIAVTASVASAVPPVRTMYGEALAREQTARVALEAPDATAASLTAVARTPGA